MYAFYICNYVYTYLYMNVCAYIYININIYTLAHYFNVYVYTKL